MSNLSDNLDRCLGERIRLERLAHGWSLSDLATRADVSRAMIHKVERGESSPTAALLGKLAGALSLSVSTLIARAEASGSRLMRANDQQVWVDPETGYRRRLVSPVVDMPLEIVSVDLPPGGAVPYGAAAFTFLRQMIWVLEGSLTFIEGETVHRLSTGDCLALGPPCDCCFSNETGRPCRYAVVLLKSD
ncbi:MULTISPECIES: helix-turn-helix domain-containing protein [Alphaproteobacteria]|uniref:LacI family transcriptional regulator n=2 Tax=Alphaproteobacteria TaxID=28211 RepID=A0A512HFT0_9HYPH|nr:MULTISPECIES: XRE family transcriptional regulator [Alphaproteobacteria]GEO84308.1 LacI family transcriptional regulator [Ciceribacter naphthalenivorans]GLR24844.1 LacI family transcriptional regulator [Ciceribacter naphthalenivorans]GLT07700.1 LacI family transcriptional regulator [Sphingomonas psychrolutea]